jgi:hypothetical protein
MSTISVTSGTTTVSSSTSSSYLVEDTGMLDVVSGGAISGLTTVERQLVGNESSRPWCCFMLAERFIVERPRLIIRNEPISPGQSLAHDPGGARLRRTVNRGPSARPRQTASSAVSKLAARSAIFRDSNNACRRARRFRTTPPALKGTVR